MCGLAIEIARDLDGALTDRAPVRSDEVAVLVQTLIGAALKISHLLWPFGRRVEEHELFREAGALRERLELDTPSPLSPLHILPLAPLLTLPAGELLTRMDAEARTIRVEGSSYSLPALVREVHQVRTAVGAA